MNRRDGSGERTSRQAAALVLGGVLLLLLSAGLGARTSRSSGSARQMYYQARALWNRMRAAPERYSDRDWRRLAGRFRLIYYRHPTSGYADDAVFREAGIYRRLYDRTNRVEDWQLAVARYKFLIQEYPYSSLNAEAYLQVAELYRRRGLKEWRTYLEQCVRRYGRRCREVDLYAALNRALRDEQARADERTGHWSRSLKVLQSIRAYPSASYTRVVLYLTDAVPYRRGILRRPDRLYIDLDGARLADDLKKKSWRFARADAIKGIRVGQFLPDTARVVLDFDRIKMHRLFTLENPFRIVIDVFREDWRPAARTAAVQRTPEPAPSPPAEEPARVPESNRNGRYSLYRQMGMKAGRIMLDPGHGGHDPGAIGVDGIKEKDITLAVAKQLKREIERRWNVEVLMTRQDDRFIPLEERTAMANSQGVDLFISIHANASRRGKIRGIETYYLQWAKDEHAMEVAARENAVTTARMHELKKFIKMILQNPKVEESKDLAVFVQNALVQAVKPRYGTKDLGVKTAPFYVLMGAEMPAILVEISFLSHPREGRLLKKEEYRRNIVAGILSGLERYLDAQGSLAQLAK